MAGRTGAGDDPAARSAILARIRRAKGQVEGIERMVRIERNLAEISAARASLLAMAKALVKYHMQPTRARAAGRDVDAMSEMYQELVDVLSKMVR